VQLAQAPEVTQINTKVDILQNSLEEVQAKTDGLTFTIPNVLDANIQYVNDIEVKGTGEDNDPWNPV
jgi:prefoldin subunit 5